MTQELKDRLLLLADQGDFGRKPDPSDIRRQAAARIEQLEAEIARLRELCRMVACASMGSCSPHRGESSIGWQKGDGADATSVQALARALLKGQGK